jgi:ABC-2 type transport system permease protein
LVALIVTAVSLFFTRLPIYNIGIVALVVLFTSTLFALAGFINGVFANNFDDISIIPTFVLTPLTYLGGVFYSLDLLPEFWAGVSKLNPLVYVVNAFRYGVLGVSDVNVGFAFAMIAGFTVLLFFYAMHLLSSGKRLRQ